jgi:CarD family transcriptional regulator
LSKDQNLINTFIPGDFVVYPSHGVGKIIGTEKRKIEETDLELLVIRFEHERMTLRVPLSKATESGLRTLSSKVQMDEANYHFKG